MPFSPLCSLSVGRRTRELSSKLITGSIRCIQGDSGPRVNAPGVSMETFSRGLFHFPIVARAASALISHIHATSIAPTWTKYSRIASIPPFSLIFIAADIVWGTNCQVPEKGGKFWPCIGFIIMSW